MTEERPVKAILGLNGQVDYVPFTDEEVQQRELDQIQWATEQAEREQEAQRIEGIKASAREKLKNAQPLTDEEAAVIVI